MIDAQSGRFTRFIGSRRALRQGLTALLVVASGAAYGETSSDYTVVDDVAIYFAVLPAEMLRGFPPGSEEARMHGGVPGESMCTICRSHFSMPGPIPASTMPALQ